MDAIKIAMHIISILVCISTTLHTVSAYKIVTYWGQNGAYASHPQRQYWEKDLAEFCKNYNYDTIILSSLDVLFDTRNKDNMPGFDFAFHCETGVTPEYPTLLRCPKIEAGIKECQQRGKTVMMSLSASTGAEVLRDDSQGKLLAYRLYHLLLEGTDLQSIRPFGTAILDGINVHIEKDMPTGYIAFIKELRRLQKTGTRKLTIGAAPQCNAILGTSPDRFHGEMADLIDEIYVQFYNNWCQTRNQMFFRYSLIQWLSYSKRTKGAKVFIGVPGARKAAIGYITPRGLKEIYNKVKTEPRFGGFMVWDASFDQNNMIGGKHFSEHISDFAETGTVSPRTVTSPTTRTSIITEPTQTIVFIRREKQPVL